MAGSKFQYDESGGTFFYFLLSFLALVVIPSTYYFWPKEKKEEEKEIDRKKCHCEQCGIKSNYIKAKEPWKKTKNRIIKILLILGWLAMLAIAYKVANTQHDYVAWDPFEILGIDPSSTTPQIKKAYRKLSLKYHPDKGGDEKVFLKISKAYEALTDEEARKNWENYGNPDGPGATSFGIALPSWIIEKENSIFVLGLYALVFMIALPTIVGIWWYRSVKYGCDQVLLSTSQLYFFFIHKTPHMFLRRVIMIIGASSEFDKSHNSEIVERPSDNFEVPQLIKEFRNLNEKNRERPLCFEYSIKARALLYAHLSRLKVSPTLELDKIYVIKKTPMLIQEFVQCCAQLIFLALNGRLTRSPHLETIEHAMKLSAMIVQACWETKSPLLQLPHINEDILRHFTTKRRNIRNIKQLATMKDDERRSMLRNLSDEQYDDIINVLSKMPLLEILVKSEVLDDEDSGTITAGAIVTVTVTLQRHNLGELFNESDPKHLHEIENSQSFNDNQETITEEGNAVVNGDVPNPAKVKQTDKGWVKSNKNKKKGGKTSKNKKKVVYSSNQQQTQQPNQQQVNQKQEKDKKEVEKVETPTSKISKKVKEIEESEDEEDSRDASSCSETEQVDEREEDASDDEQEWSQIQNKVSRKEKALETKSRQSHSVHCPYFPDDKQEYWWIYIADRKKHTLMTNPFLMTNLVNEEEVELKFTAPPKPGIYSYSVIVRSDSFIDFDVIKNIKLDVKEAKQIKDHVQWDISEDEKDDKDKEEDSAVEDSDLLETEDEDEEKEDNDSDSDSK